MPGTRADPPGHRPESKRRTRGARHFNQIVFGCLGCPGGASAPPGLEGYFFALAFFTFFAFFAFFAFLAIASSSGFNGWKRDTRHARGGLASQQPRLISEQIRRLLPLAVTSPSLRYPQLLCIFRRFLPRDASRAALSRLTAHQRGIPAASIRYGGAVSRGRPRSSSFQNHSADCPAVVRVR